MKHLLLAIASFFCLACWTGAANAGLMFGTDESIQFVAKTNLPGPAGEALYLGRKITRHSFLLPYSAQDDGFVLGVWGDSKRYFPWPGESKVKVLQAMGHLPNPLPEWRPSTIDQLMNHGLWVCMGGFALYLGIKALPRKRQGTVTTEMPSSSPPTESPTNDIRQMTIGPMPTLALRNARSKNVMFLVVSLLLFLCGLVGAWAGKPGEQMPSWMLMVIFGPAILVLGWKLFDRTPRLEINEQGVLDRSLGIDLIPWSEIRGAHLQSIMGKTFVSLQLRDANTDTANPSILARTMSSMDRALAVREIHLNLSGLDVNPQQVVEAVLARCAASSTSSGT